MTPLIDAARELLSCIDECTDLPRTDAEYPEDWPAPHYRRSLAALHAAVEDAEADLARAADVAAGRA